MQHDFTVVGGATSLARGHLAKGPTVRRYAVRQRTKRLRSNTSQAGRRVQPPRCRGPSIPGCYRRRGNLVWDAELGKSESVHHVHTLAFGLSLTGAGPGRIAEVCGGVAESQGPAPGSSPTSGTVLSQFSGLWAAECVQISSYGPLRGLFVGWDKATSHACVPDVRRSPAKRFE